MTKDNEVTPRPFQAWWCMTKSTNYYKGLVARLRLDAEKESDVEFLIETAYNAGRRHVLAAFLGLAENLNH
jgi:hypothetical protein